MGETGCLSLGLLLGLAFGVVAAIEANVLTGIAGFLAVLTITGDFMQEIDKR